MRTGRPKVAFKQRIKKTIDLEARHIRQSGGSGQYAVISVEIQYDPEVNGFEFIDGIKGGAVPREYIPSVEAGLRESFTTGGNTGIPFVSTKARLYDGKSHDVDSSEMAFRAAANLAFRQAIEDNTVLLEPIMSVEVTVPDEFVGSVVGDLNSRRGEIAEIVHLDDDTRAVRAMVPIAEMFAYSSALAGSTQGRGAFGMELAEYRDVPAGIAAKLMENAERRGSFPRPLTATPPVCESSPAGSPPAGRTIHGSGRDRRERRQRSARPASGRRVARRSPRCAPGAAARSPPAEPRRSQAVLEERLVQGAVGVEGVGDASDQGFRVLALEERADVLEPSLDQRRAALGVGASRRSCAALDLGPVAVPRGADLRRRPDRARPRSARAPPADLRGRRGRCVRRPRWPCQVACHGHAPLEGVVVRFERHLADLSTEQVGDHRVAGLVPAPRARGRRCGPRRQGRPPLIAAERERGRRRRRRRRRPVRPSPRPSHGWSRWTRRREDANRGSRCGPGASTVSSSSADGAL